MCITISQTLLETQLDQQLAGIVPNLSATSLSGSSATSIRKLVPPDKLGAALKAYNDSMRSVWYLGLTLACLALLASFGLEWKSVKTKKPATEDNGNSPTDNTQ